MFAAIGVDEVVAGVAQLGLSVVLVIFFVWQSSRREERLAAAISQMQQFQQTELLKVAERSVAAIEAGNRILAEVVTSIEECHARTRRGPAGPN